MQHGDQPPGTGTKPPAWTSKKFWISILAVSSWTAIIMQMLYSGLGVADPDIALPGDLWWAMVIKGSVEVLSIGGITALDAYATKLPFSAALKRTDDTRREPLP